MRITIRLRDTTWAKLVETAAHRGEKGFSGIVQEALDEYFRAHDRSAAVQTALTALGSLHDEEADRLEEHVRGVRQAWR